MYGSISILMKLLSRCSCVELCSKKRVKKMDSSNNDEDVLSDSSVAVVDDNSSTCSICSICSICSDDEYDDEDDTESSTDSSSCNSDDCKSLDIVKNVKYDIIEYDDGSPDFYIYYMPIDATVSSEVLCKWRAYVRTLLWTSILHRSVGWKVVYKVIKNKDKVTYNPQEFCHHIVRPNVLTESRMLQIIEEEINTYDM